MPRAKVNPSKKNSNSSSGLKFFLLICILLIAQNAFLLYRNYDKAKLFVQNLIPATDSLNAESDSDSLFTGETVTTETDAKSTESGAVQNTKTQSSETASQLSQNAASGKMVKVSILNGCGVTGLAGKWKSALRNMGYDVRETDNSKEKYPASVILCRTDDKNQGYALAAKLGIDKKNVIPQKNKNIVDIDFTLVLGKDHQKLKSN